MLERGRIGGREGGWERGRMGEREWGGRMGEGGNGEDGGRWEGVGEDGREGVWEGMGEGGSRGGFGLAHTLMILGFSVRDLWEEPASLCVSFHNPIPGSVHLLYLRLQHHHEGKTMIGWNSHNS